MLERRQLRPADLQYNDGAVRIASGFGADCEAAAGGGVSPDRCRTGSRSGTHRHGRENPRHRGEPTVARAMKRVASPRVNYRGRDPRLTSIEPARVTRPRGASVKLSDGALRAVSGIRLDRTRVDGRYCARVHRELQNRNKRLSFRGALRTRLMTWCTQRSASRLRWVAASAATERDDEENTWSVDTRVWRPFDSLGRLQLAY